MSLKIPPRGRWHSHAQTRGVRRRNGSRRGGLTAGRWSLASAVALLALASASLLPAASASAQGPGGGGEETATNNLSFPVIWAGGDQLVIPGIYEKPELSKSVPYHDPETETTIQVYPQGDPENTWQAQNEASLMPVEVDEIDWGDNLEAKSLTLGKPVRVETTLLKNLGLGEEMKGFKMVSLEGEKREEVFATTGEEYESEQATIYSACARLTIQRLLISREDPYLYLLKWDAATGEWTGEELISPAVFNGGAWAGGEGTGYSAEVNGSGKAIYGYNWLTSGLQAGDYRITFSFDQSCASTLITEATKVAFSEEETAVTAAAEESGSGGVSGGGVPQIDASNNLSYVDVQLGTPSYEPYVPPSPEPEEEETTTTTTTTQTIPVITVTTTASSQTQTQAKTRKHVTVKLHKKIVKHDRKRIVYRLWGKVSPPRNGQKLRIQIRTKRGWRTVAVVRLQKQTKTASKYSLRLRNPRKGTYRAMMVRNDKYYAGISRKVKLRHT